MLDPDLVLSTIRSSFLLIPEVVAELPGGIIAHTYTYGVENALARAIEQMDSGSALVAYQDLLGGNFSGESIWKHRLSVYLRPRNGGASPPHLWWLMMNKPLSSTGLNLRYSKLIGGSLMIPDTPTLTFQQDAMLSDFFIGSLVFPEEGDD